MNIFERFFGTYSQREIKKIDKIADSVIDLEDKYAKLTDKELKGKTAEFKERLKNETLDDILPEAFATVREASWRVLGMKPYRVQVLGGIVLHEGRIAEMKTGEGKTLVSTMPAYLNALTGDGVYVITVNEYLAKRDSEQMGKIHNYLGLSVGFLGSTMDIRQRKAQYAKDILYTTNNEIGFDYLRDNMVAYKQLQVQRGFNYSIIDEVDSILIDEARTPLIISGEGDDFSAGYIKANNLVKNLNGIVRDPQDDNTNQLEALLSSDDAEDEYAGYDYVVDEKSNSVMLTDNGIDKAEEFYDIENLTDIENMEINHYISRALKAHSLFKKNIDYIVSDESEIVIIDEHTGRTMDGRRYSEGIHQAIEIKEDVEVKKESKTLATISFQNLFSKFNKLSGMTGTAMTEAEEFIETYNLDSVEIPTNKPVIREDKSDKVYLTKEGKMGGIVDTVKECNKNGQPVLVGTASVETSEEISELFTKEGIKHSVLNAKNHAQEARIVAKAGEYGTVTVATNMAGRGTDIMLGGNVEFKTKMELKRLDYSHSLIEESNTHTVSDDEEVVEVREKYKEIEERIKKEVEPWVEKVKAAGGLYVLGTERHESRRIDNQLRGRAGRQGDPGVSEFMISLEDDLMRVFGAERFSSIFTSMNMPEDMPIEAKLIANAVEKAQERIEANHYNARRSLVEYDIVMNTQRDIVYEQRNRFLNNDEEIIDDISELLLMHVKDSVYGNVQSETKVTMEDQERIRAEYAEIPGLTRLPSYTETELATVKPEDIVESMQSEVKGNIEFFKSHTNIKESADYFRKILLFFIDNSWQYHLIVMDDLLEGVGLRAYAEDDPIMAYKEEGFKAFEQMLGTVRKDTFMSFMNSYNSVVQRVAFLKAQHEQIENDENLQEEYNVEK